MCGSIAEGSWSTEEAGAVASADEDEDRGEDGEGEEEEERALEVVVEEVGDDVNGNASRGCSNASTLMISATE